MSQLRHLLQQHAHWPAVDYIYHSLTVRGYKAFLAGGCVRDALLGVAAHDLDVATDASPGEIESLFPNTVAVGKSFGVMRVLTHEADIEVATFRADGEYKDGRRPESVQFSSPERDAQRRDFTVNALFYDLANDQVLDFVGGQKDLARRLLTTVGEAERRFAEDHLRLLRAARFVGQLDFSLSASTEEALGRMSSQVATVSGERIHEEMAKLLRAPAVEKSLQVLVRSGLMKVLFPFRERDAKGDELSLAVHSWQSFAIFFRNASGAELKEILFRLRFSVREQRAIERSWQLWRQPGDFFGLPLAKKLLRMNEEGFPWALRVLKVDAEMRNRVETLEQAWATLGERLPEPFLRGADVVGLQGRAIGECLQAAFEMQLEGRLRNREQALQWLQSYKRI